MSSRSLAPYQIRRLAKPWVRRLRRAHVPVVGPLRWWFRGCYLLHVAAREMLALACKVCWYEPLWRSQCAAVGRNFQMEQLPYLFGRGRIVIGSNVRLSGKSNFIFTDCRDALPELRIGDGTFIGHHCRLTIAAAVTIGRHCLIAGGVTIADNDGHPLDAQRRRCNEPMTAESIAAVSIGDDVWIGNGAQVLKGVTVGDRSVIGAGAVVARDVPPDVVVVGNPARIVKHLSNAARRPASNVRDQVCSAAAAV